MKKKKRKDFKASVAVPNRSSVVIGGSVVPTWSGDILNDIP